MEKQQVVAAQAMPAAGATDPRLQMRGVQPGGMYTKESHCGPLSIVIGILLCPCICFCPVDSREVYVEPGTGRRVVL
jgi:hypothetical protein